MLQDTHPTLRLLALVAATVTAWAACGASALADNVCPAYLDVEELEPGSLRVIWKVPRGQRLPTSFSPAFAESFRVASPKNRVEMPDAIIEKWSLVCAAGDLQGATISVNGLGETTMDALVRIQLADGSTHRAILRPTENSMTVPVSELNVSQGKSGIPSAHLYTHHWLYLFLFSAAWLLSVNARVKQRGILFCAVALVAGSLCGHALGRLPFVERLHDSGIPSDAEAKRILHGLMMNTYRAFVLDNDEEVYDVLARSVEGEFLREVYLQNIATLRIDDSDTAESIIERLDIRSIESKKRLKSGAIEIVANWDVYGSVRHWDHIHFRCNAYRAMLTIVPTGDYWKLSSVQVLDEERVI
jgi:hypothetical protein